MWHDFSVFGGGGEARFVGLRGPGLIFRGSASTPPNSIRNMRPV